MLKFKNVIAILLAGAMLAGCAPKVETPVTPAPSEPTAAAPAAPAAEAPAPAPAAPAELKPVELTWYFVGPFPQPDQDMVFEEFNKKLKEKINATVNFIPAGFQDYDQKMKVIIASGEDYDICFTSNWINNYNLNASKGAFAELDGLLAEYAPKTFAQVPKDFWDATRIGGKIYGVINEQISARAPTYGVNTALAAKYNFDVNTVAKNDISGFEPLLAAAIKDNPKSYFYSPDFDNPAYFKQDFIAGWNIPGAIYADDAGTKVFNQYESPEVMKYADVLRDFNAKGFMNPTEVIAQKSVDGDVTSGKQIAKMDGAYKPGVDIAEKIRYKTDITDVPGGEPVLTTGGITATMQAISRNSKNPERAMMLLEIMNTDQEMYNLLNFGIKDTHFTIDAEGFMVKEGDAAAKYAPGVPWMFASNYMAFVDKGMPKDVWDQTRKMNAEAKRSPLIGFNFDLDPVKAEVGQCSAVIEEYYKTILRGIATKEQYNEFVTKLKEAGSDKVIAEMQKQIDAWKTSK